MNRRAVVTIILAVVLIVVVMGVTAVLAAAGGDAVKYEEQAAWSYPLAGVETLKILDLTGDGQNEVFAQSPSELAVLDASGQPLFVRSLQGASSVVSTLGDMNADGVEDIITVEASGGGAGVTVLNGEGAVLWRALVATMSEPLRAAVVRFEGGTQLVVGDGDGQLAALDSSGQEIWRDRLSGGDYIRGLDETDVAGQHNLAAANHNGAVALYDADGRPRWQYNLGEVLRRMRAFDLDKSGISEILIGGEQGRLVMLDASGEGEQLSERLGQTITEIREGEIDGDPSSREFVVGGKDGGVWAYRADGQQLWARSASGRVSEIIFIDTDGDGINEVLVGDEAGGLTIFTGAAGISYRLDRRSSAVTSMDTGSLSGAGQFLVGDGQTVASLGLNRQVAPVWYNPLLAGGIISLIIIVIAWFVATMPQRPDVRAAATDQSVEGLRARRLMLHEAIADVERLRGTGEMPADAYLLRLKELRSEMADTEAALLKAGEKIQVETFKCPNCGGTLSLGTDRCDYCGQVVIR